MKVANSLGSFFVVSHILNASALMPPVCYQGIGSYPLPPQGWQRSIRFRVRTSPFNGPCFLSASTAYSEQVGTYLHEAGVYGEMQYL
jgi:hypothetical protein